MPHLSLTFVNARHQLDLEDNNQKQFNSSSNQIIILNKI
jgi:hypothetical protein